jgi:transcriptional regulator with XRE-family HTH domain
MDTSRQQPTSRHAFGRAIRELRARRGFSQEDLGFASHLHRNYVGAIERGEINPTFRVLLKLERGLDMPLSELIAKYEELLTEGSADLRRPSTFDSP